MTNLPEISNAHKICVVCEGFEDIQYFDKLIKLAVWSSNYSFNLINAKSASNIFPRYQSIYNMNSYEIVLIFCDTDKYPYPEYKKIVSKINEFHGKDVAENIIIYANPCTMQIILSHFGDVQLTTQSKKVNSKIIETLTGVENYDAHEDQIKQICSRIYQRTYADMKCRIAKINKGSDEITSTNFIDFLEKFESEDVIWITEVNNILE